MRYVFVSFNYSPIFTSPESWFTRTEGYLGVLEHLAKDNIVINVKQIDYEGIREHNGVEHRFVKFERQKTYFPFKLIRYIKQLKPDIVFVQGLHHPLQVIQLRLILGQKVNIVAQHHAEKPFIGIKKYIQRMADKGIDAYLFASHELGKEWMKNGNIASAKKIHEVMEVSSVFYPVSKTTSKTITGVSGDPVFLWVGRLNANKDPLNVVRAFLNFSAMCPTACLYMIYHTDELLEEINQLLQKKPANNRIILVGKVPHDELLYWYNSADFIISASHYEGSGTVVCEAMSCGCIPLITDIPSFRMITDNGACGSLYEAGNEKALLSVLLQTQTMNIKEKQENCLTYFKTHLSFEAIAGQIQQIVQGLQAN